MALGRVSAFSNLGRPRAGTSGTNLPASAMNENPFASIEKRTDAIGGGDAPGAAPSPVTGMTPQANAVVGQGINLGLGAFGIPGLGGLLAGLLGQSGLPGLALSKGIDFASGQLGGKLGFPTSIGKAAEMGLNMIAPNFPLSVNPNADPTMTLGQTGLTPAQMATLANPDVFGLGDLSGVALGSLGARGSGFGSFAGFGSGKGGGTGIGTVGHGVPAAGNPAGGFTNPTQFGLANSPASGPPGISPTTGLPTSGDPQGEGTTGDAPGTVGDTSGEAGSGFHEGGFVGLDNTGPHSEDTYGPDDAPDYSQGEVDATLEQGEFVVNKEAAGRFGPLLNKLNKIGRSQELKDVLQNILEGVSQNGFEVLRNIK